MDKWVVYILLAVCLSSCGQASGNKQVKQGTDSLQNDTVVSHSVDSLAYAYLKSGRIMYENGDKLGAIAKYNKAIEIDPLYMLAYYNRGLSKSKIGDNQGAIDDYSKAIKINPLYVVAYYNRGLSKSKLGDKQGAIEDYTKAIQLDSQHFMSCLLYTSPSPRDTR